jgi:hypothetical protein
MAPQTHEVLTQLRSLRESLPPPTEQDKDIREELLVELRKLCYPLSERIMLSRESAFR